ncbi:MAG: hypothetical protein BZY75_04645 [SAR202 cluster bacterium Io17-Chloro-G7]|nr:MAG: hypothetical protein BZY75_04645 [SAR202 cluster bacterium Io17-Chloro-G7]
MFDEQRLTQEIIPKLSEYTTQDASYPFLVTSYMLESKTDVSIEMSVNQEHTGNVKFKPRRRRTVQQNEAVIYSVTRYRLLR